MRPGVHLPHGVGSIWWPFGVAVALGAVAALLPADLDLRAVAVTILGGSAILGTVALGPLACLCVLAFLTLLNLTPSLVALGAIDFRLSDLFYVALLGWFMVGWLRGERRDGRTRSLRLVAALPLLAWIGLSVWWTAVAAPASFPVSFASYLRLLQTGTIVGLAGWVLRSQRDVRALLFTVSAAGGVGVLLALLERAGYGGQVSSERYGGILNPNSLGLISGVLVVIALFMTTRRRFVRFAIGATGVLGLLLVKSIGASIGTVVAVSVGVLWTVGHSESARRYRNVMIAGLIGLGASLLLVVGLFRSETLPTSEDFRSSSAYHRIILGTAGMRIFLDHPIAGVGWQRSPLPAVIGAEELDRALREQFPDVNYYLYPAVEPSNVHNAYIQVLAELGLVGFSLLLLAIISLARDVGDVQLATRGNTGLSALALVLALSLVLVLVWWNDNAIFGGQTETIVACLFLGGLVAIPRIVSRDS